MKFAEALSTISDALPKASGFVVPAIAGVTVLAISLVSFTTIDPGEVAVRVNNLTGNQESITQPGLALRVPILHSIQVLSAAPQTFSMRGEETVDPLNVSKLTVRASDGSNFHFDEFALVFQLKGDEAVLAISDGGQGEGYLRWMRPYARSILRDEFGRLSTIEVSDPSSYAEAGERSRERLNELLGRHGVLVTQVVTPRPKFNDAYEAAIEQRNALGNELEVIRSNLEMSETERARKLSEVDQQQNKLIQERRAQLETELSQATARQAQVKRETDTYRIEKVGQGQAALSGAEARARELVGALDAKYRAKKAEVDAFRTQPIERVMERLAESLDGVTIDIQPFAEDASPTRIRLDK